MKSTILTAFVLATVAMQAQSDKPQGVTSQPHQTDSSLTAQTRTAFQSVSENILNAAREMPETSYSFKSASGVRSFGDLISHIAEVQATLCAGMNGHQVASGPNLKASKDDRIKSLANSVSECQVSFDELSAQNVNKTVQTPEGELTHMGALIFILTHASVEYGQLGVYLRLNHLMPPTSDETKGIL